MTNAVEHAYPPGQHGNVTTRASATTVGAGSRQLTVTVTDHGSWLDPPPQRDHLHGIPLMRASCDGLSILGTATGTRVTITSTSPDHNP